MAASSEEGQEETLTLAAQEEQPPPTTNASSSGGLAEAEEDSSAEKTLELASELFNKGAKAVEDGDYVEAVDCFSRALEIRVAHYGELASECAVYYYKYGCALLYKSQEEADPLVNVPPTNSEKDKSSKGVGVNEGSKGSAGSTMDSKASCSSGGGEDGASEKDQEDGSEDSDGDGEELAEADEDDSDLDLAWKMLDVARAIVEKSPEDTIEKVNIFAALGEVSMEREDFETSLNDYLKALSILERLVEPDNRRVVELNFRICLVLEVWSKVEEAIPYCQKAISLCKSRLKRITEDVKPTPLPDDIVNNANGAGTETNQAAREGNADAPVDEDGKEVLSGILSELERKLEDLQHILSNPKSIFSEIMKIVASKSASGEVNISRTESRSSSLNSSQMGVVNGGFDSPTISTAATNSGGITHLGVVGRGVKRASLTPVCAEPSKKLSLSSSSEKDGSSASEVVDSTGRDAEAANE